MAAWRASFVAGWCLTLPTITAAIALAAPAVLAAQQGDATAVVGRAARVYRSVGALQADFVQTITDPMLGPEESRGTLVQAGQNRLAMRFSDPEGDAIVVDGTWIWVYTPSTTPGQVVRMPVPTGPVYGFNILGWLLDKPVERYRSRYLRADTVGGRAVDVVEMIPLSEDIPFSRAVLWVDREDALPRRLDVKERGGLTRSLVLSSLRPNAPTTERTFAFRAPRGTKVVEQ